MKWKLDLRDKLPSLGKDPRVVARAVLGVLLAANLAAAFMLVRPWGGSPQDLARQLKDLQQQGRQRKLTIERLRFIVSKVEQGRTQDNQFINTYMMDRRTTASTIVADLSKAEQDAGIKSKGSSFAFELIKGSDTLGMMAISANYEGNYGSLLKFVNVLDRSPRFVLIDSLQATPQSSGAALNVSMKFYAFVREEKATQ